MAGYGNLAGRALSIIEDIRYALSEGIANRKVVLAIASTAEGEKGPDQLQRHPTLGVLEAAALAEVVVVDDRSINQLGGVQGAHGVTPIRTTLDLLTEPAYSPAERREYLTAMRRAGLAFVPVGLEELMALVEQASTSEGKLIESAELKALRESLQMARMSNALQLPQEHVWLDSVILTFAQAIRAQWRAGFNEETARARSDWLLEQLDIRRWSHRLKVDGHPEFNEIRYRNQILSLAMLNLEVPAAVKERYWEWLNAALLARIRDEQPELYSAVVQRVTEIIDSAVTRSEAGGSSVG